MQLMATQVMVTCRPFKTGESIWNWLFKMASRPFIPTRPPDVERQEAVVDGGRLELRHRVPVDYHIFLLIRIAHNVIAVIG